MRSTYSILSGVNTDILPNNSKPNPRKERNSSHLEKANKIQKKKNHKTKSLD